MIGHIAEVMWCLAVKEGFQDSWIKGKGTGENKTEEMFQMGQKTKYSSHVGRVWVPHSWSSFSANEQVKSSLLHTLWPSWHGAVSCLYFHFLQIQSRNNGNAFPFGCLLWPLFRILHSSLECSGDCKDRQGRECYCYLWNFHLCSIPACSLHCLSNFWGSAAWAELECVGDLQWFLK